MIPLRDSDGAITFSVKVHPRAKKNTITGELGDALKVELRHYRPGSIDAAICGDFRRLQTCAVCVGKEVVAWNNCRIDTLDWGSACVSEARDRQRAKGDKSGGACT